MQEEFTLPPWIEGFDRKVLHDYVNGVKPKEIKQRYGVDNNFISLLREKYAIPAQLELRRRGILPPTPFGEGSSINKRLAREARIDGAVAEYIKSEKPNIIAVAGKFKISPTVLSDRLKAKGVALKPGRRKGDTGGPNELTDRNRAIVDLVIKQGKTLEEAAQAQIPPISRERVRQICARAGYKLGVRESIKQRLRDRREESRFKHPLEDEIIEVLRQDRHYPKDIAEKYGVDRNYLDLLRNKHGLPRGNKLNWRTDEQLEIERQAIDAYYNRPDLTSAQISEQILKVNNPAGITQLIKRRGLERTRGKLRWGKDYKRNTTRRKFSEETRLAAMADYQDPKVPLKAIYDKYKIGPALLSAWRKSYEVAKVPRAFGSGRGSWLNKEQAERVDKAIKEGHAAGKSRNKIARELGLKQQRITRRARAMGLTFPKSNYQGGKPKDLTPLERERLDSAIRDGALAGKSMALIAEEMNMTLGRVQRRARALGVQFPAKPAITRTKVSRQAKGKGPLYEPTPEILARRAERRVRDAQVVADYKAGVPPKEIITKHKIQNSALYVILDKANVKRNRRIAKGDKKPATPAQQAVLADYKAGMPRQEIFNKHAWLKGKNSSLDSLCIRFGVKRPEAHARVKDEGTGRSMSAKQHEMILRMYKPGRTPIQRLADKVGLSYNATRNFLVKQGVYQPVPSDLYSKVGKRK